MKIINFFVITGVLILSQLAIFAQETPTLKKFAEDFWKFLAEGRLVAAEGRLDSIKRREPNFDASKMEKALTDAKSKKEGDRAESRNALMAKINASNTLDSLFGSRNIQSDSSDTAESIKAEIEKYAKMTDEILAANRAEISKDLERIPDGIKRSFADADEKNSELVRQTQQATDSKNAETAYYELLLRQSYLDNACKIFPDDGEIKKAFDSITTSINSLGTPEQRAARAEKNLNAKIDAERLPKAGQRDANLEKQFQNAFNNMNQGRNLQYTFLKSVIVSSDFGIVRHSLTGIVLGRYLIGAIAFKTSDGKCKQGRFRIDQNYVGNSFSGSWRGDFADFTHEMRCENVSK